MRKVWLGLAMVVLAACGPHVGSQGTDVGAACTSNQQCASTCLSGNDHYPGGMCTILCSSDVQCPKGSACTADGNRGICAVSCLNPSDCASFGRGFTCDAADHFGVGGSTLVCRVP
jgi:hypothetical protein